MAASKQLDAQFVIYGLSLDGKTHRYVGYTGQKGLRMRLTAHRHRARRGDSEPLYEWMRDGGLDDVVATVLEKLPHESTRQEMGEREMHWIARLRQEGFDLLNLTLGGDGTQGFPGPRWPRDETLPTNAELRTGKRRGPYKWADMAKQQDSGARAAHNRWHVARDKTSPTCALCADNRSSFGP